MKVDDFNSRRGRLHVDFYISDESREVAPNSQQSIIVASLSLVW